MRAGASRTIMEKKKEAATTPTERPPRYVTAVRMSPEIAKAIAGKLVASIPIPAEIEKPKPGDRLFLREWVGAPTGRADLVTVLHVEGDELTIERPWGWASHKLDDDLSQLGLIVRPDVFPKIGF